MDPSAGATPARSSHSASASRLSHRVEEAAGAIVDLWGLSEVGGCVRIEERRRAERTLTKAVSDLRAFRLQGHR